MDKLHRLQISDSDSIRELLISLLRMGDMCDISLQETILRLIFNVFKNHQTRLYLKVFFLSSLDVQHSWYVVAHFFGEKLTENIHKVRS